MKGDEFPEGAWGVREGDDSAEVTPRATSVPSEERTFSVYCGPHPGKGRHLVAVVTKQGRLVTDIEDLDWVTPPYDQVLAPCRLCPMTWLGRHERGHQVTAGGRSLSVRKLKELRKHTSRDVRLDEVLHEGSMLPAPKPE